jgi:hypothetical protein
MGSECIQVAIRALNLALDGVDWSASRPRLLTPEERIPGTHWIGGWVGPIACLNPVEESLLSVSEIEPRFFGVQPVVH